jgi:hypothetical protein
MRYILGAFPVVFLGCRCLFSTRAFFQPLFFVFFLFINVAGMVSYCLATFIYRKNVSMRYKLFRVVSSSSVTRLH